MGFWAGQGLSATTSCTWSHFIFVYLYHIFKFTRAGTWFISIWTKDFILELLYVSSGRWEVMEILTKVYFHNFEGVRTCLVDQKEQNMRPTNRATLTQAQLEWKAKFSFDILHFFFFCTCECSQWHFFLLAHTSSSNIQAMELTWELCSAILHGWLDFKGLLYEKRVAGWETHTISDRPKRLTVLEELLFLCDTITKCHLIARTDIQQQHFISTKSDLVPFANFQI